MPYYNTIQRTINTAADLLFYSRLVRMRNMTRGTGTAIEYLEKNQQFFCVSILHSWIEGCKIRFRSKEHIQNIFKTHHDQKSDLTQPFHYLL